MPGATVAAFYLPVQCWNDVRLLSRWCRDVWNQCKWVLQPRIFAALSWSCFALHISSPCFSLEIEHHQSLVKQNETFQRIHRKRLFFFFFNPSCGFVACRVVSEALPLVTPSVEFPQNQRAVFWKSSKIIIWTLQKRLQPLRQFWFLIGGRGAGGHSHRREKNLRHPPFAHSLFGKGKTD